MWIHNSSFVRGAFSVKLTNCTSFFYFLFLTRHLRTSKLIPYSKIFAVAVHTFARNLQT